MADILPSEIWNDLWPTRPTLVTWGRLLITGQSGYEPSTALSYHLELKPRVTFLGSFQGAIALPSSSR